MAATEKQAFRWPMGAGRDETRGVGGDAVDGGEASRCHGHSVSCISAQAPNVRNRLVLYPVRLPLWDRVNWISTLMIKLAGGGLTSN